MQCKMHIEIYFEKHKNNKTVHYIMPFVFDICVQFHFGLISNYYTVCSINASISFLKTAIMTCFHNNMVYNTTHTLI